MRGCIVEAVVFKVRIHFSSKDNQEETHFSMFSMRLGKQEQYFVKFLQNFLKSMVMTNVKMNMHADVFLGGREKISLAS